MSIKYEYIMKDFFRILIFITLSTRITLAPKSLKTLPQNGTGARPANSITLMPFKAT